MDDAVTGPAEGGRRSTDLLGLPPDARVLILNLDDFGMYRAVNVAVIRSIEDGIAGSCSLMVPCPGAQHALRLLRERPKIPVRCAPHLVLPSSRDRRPVTARCAGAVDGRAGPLRRRRIVVLRPG